MAKHKKSKAKSLLLGAILIIAFILVLGIYWIENQPRCMIPEGCDLLTPTDIRPVCGDGLCEGVENCVCVKDCGECPPIEATPYCGDANCDTDENYLVCPTDCKLPIGTPKNITINHAVYASWNVDTGDGFILLQFTVFDSKDTQIVVDGLYDVTLESTCVDPITQEETTQELATFSGNVSTSDFDEFFLSPTESVGILVQKMLPFTGIYPHFEHCNDTLFLDLTVDGVTYSDSAHISG